MDGKTKSVTKEAETTVWLQPRCTRPRATEQNDMTTRQTWRQQRRACVTTDEDGTQVLQMTTTTSEVRCRSLAKQSCTR